jgi:hypothetical protein
MILLPSIETVVILTPRTGSSSLRHALRERWPDAMQIYRHMEADGVPQGYDRWRRVGLVRRPLDRLWSLYKFCRDYENRTPDTPGYSERMRASADRPFDDWLLNNQTVFTSPFDETGSRYFPRYTCRHPMPENRKSQWFYLRPDLGTEVYRYDDPDSRRLMWRLLDVKPARERQNRTPDETLPAVTDAMRDHMQRFHEWDMRVTGRATREQAA